MKRKQTASPDISWHNTDIVNYGVTTNYQDSLKSIFYNRRKNGQAAHNFCG